MTEFAVVIALGICIATVLFAIVISIMLLSGTIEIDISINRKEYGEPEIEDSDAEY
jgi:hypothetical protein